MSNRRDQAVFDVVKNALNWGSRGFSRVGNLWLPLSVYGISPALGSAAGGVAVTISGEGFQPGATAKIGGIACTSVVVVNPTTITAVTPAGTIAQFATATPGVVDVVLTNSDAQSGTLVGGYRQRLQRGVVLDGTAEALVNLAVTPWPNGASTIVARVYRRTDAAQRAHIIFSEANSIATSDEYMLVGGNTTGRPAYIVQTANVNKYNAGGTNNTADINNWLIFVLSRTSAGVITGRVAELGGSYSSAGDSAAYNGVPAFTKFRIGSDGGDFASITFAGCAVYQRELSTQERADLLSDMQYWPANPYCATIIPGLGGSIAGGFADHGTTGGMAVTAVAMEAGDLVDDDGAGTAYPVAA